MPIYRGIPPRKEPGKSNYLQWFKKFLTARAQRKEKLANPSQKEPPKDTSILGGKPYISRHEAIWKIKKGPSKVTKFGKRYTEKEREELAKKSFEKAKVGPYLEKSELQRVIKELEKKLYDPYTKWRGREKEDFKKDIEDLKKRLFGK
jgi:hypothetical protein